MSISREPTDSEVEDMYDDIYPPSDGELERRATRKGESNKADVVKPVLNGQTAPTARRIRNVTRLPVPTDGPSHVQKRPTYEIMVRRSLSELANEGAQGISREQIEQHMLTRWFSTDLLSPACDNVFHRCLSRAIDKLLKKQLIAKHGDNTFTLVNSSEKRDADVKASKTTQTAKTSSLIRKRQRCE